MNTKWRGEGEGDRLLLFLFFSLFLRPVLRNSRRNEAKKQGRRAQTGEGRARETREEIIGFGKGEHEKPEEKF
jgi:hypothetical protein